MEETEEIDIQEIKEYWDFDVRTETLKEYVNTLIQAVKQLDNRVKELEEQEEERTRRETGFYE